ncbi:hypothetical protein SAMN05720761_10573 [Fibrobacter sp. UWCM]|uniref:hypothetical protein n=1 Tax=unclassified Fibrobacter TaxID=2634177 RepID=UPI00091D92F1|nr:MULTISPECIES: hypothetical protein [unclassified Fibrobacter]MBQ9226037.1 hypothetical protein [Fibrobacter sp.]MBR2058803.1 hypothetical protein [Fibrobacter sp.]MBR2306425.1 hypothetical protein [Fibrobacter sp.]MBR4006733.1 hypothetical protein [Fibrobacter sp.]SHG80323.1 hypothetical protein SAMN05720761_10573 [Fibrobacter sp. UWCM]
MSKFGNILLLLVLALSMEVFAQRNNELEFAGIPFGASRETVIEEVMKMGYEPYGQMGAGERVVLPMFRFGELPVQVSFIFNGNDKFYAFEIRTGKVEESRKFKAIEAAEYMSDQFTLKYGKPAQAPTVNETNLVDGRNNYQEWYGVKLLNAFTAVIKKGGKYFVLGYVEHRTLMKETAGGKTKKEKASAAPVF